MGEIHSVDVEDDQFAYRHVAYFSALSRSWHATAPLLLAYAS